MAADRAEQIAEKYAAWVASLPKCVGYGGQCDGDLVGMEHADHCPMRGKEWATLRDAYEAGFREAFREAAEIARKHGAPFVNQASAIAAALEKESQL